MLQTKGHGHGRNARNGLAAKVPEILTCQKPTIGALIIRIGFL